MNWDIIVAMYFFVLQIKKIYVEQNGSVAEDDIILEFEK